MKDAVLRAPVACPDCAQEFLAEFPEMAVARALASGDTIRLFASCHGKAWNANSVEREQLREYLEAARMTRSPVQRDREQRDQGRRDPEQCDERPRDMAASRAMSAAIVRLKC